MPSRFGREQGIGEDNRRLAVAHLEISGCHSTDQGCGDDRRTAYSDAQLGKKNLGLGGVLVSRGGCIVCWFDVSTRYQAIKRLFFSCTRIFSPFFDAPAAHSVAQDCQFFVIYGNDLRHLTAL
jgi:hypothetical protein